MKFLKWMIFGAFTGFALCTYFTIFVVFGIIDSFLSGLNNVFNRVRR